MTVKEMAREFATCAHQLDCDSWSAWWAADRYAAEIQSPLLPLIEAGANRVGQNMRTTKEQLAAAKKLFEQVLQDREVWQ